MRSLLNSLSIKSMELTYLSFSLATSENGWTSNFLCHEWYKIVFIPHATANNKSGKPILLIYDGHGSHLTGDMMNLAVVNNIHLFALPPHTTHRLQPLDVGIFNLVQRAWQKQCVDYAGRTGEGMQRHHVIREYMTARASAVNQSNILNAWRKTGIHPLNPDIFTTVDYAPSNPTSVSSVLPESFPTYDDLPSDWAIPSSDDPDFGPDMLAGPSCTAQESEDSNSDTSTTSSDSSVTVPFEFGVEPAINKSTSPLSHEFHSPGPPLPPTFNIQLRASSLQTTRCTRSMSARHSLSRTTSMSISTPISRPTTPFSTTTSSSSSLSRARQQEYEDEIAQLRAERDELRTKVEEMESKAEEMQWQRDAAFGHAIVLRRDYNQLKSQMNAKEEKLKRKGRGVRVHSMMTSTDMRKKIAEEAVRAEKKKNAEEAKKRMEAKAAAVQAQREAMDGTEVYSGKLSTKNKTELENIAIALGFSEADLKVTKNDLISRIKQHLDETPVLQEHPQFSGLYNSRARPSCDLLATDAATGMPAPGATSVPQAELFEFDSDLLTFAAPQIPTASASLVHPSDTSHHYANVSGSAQRSMGS